MYTWKEYQDAKGNFISKEDIERKREELVASFNKKYKIVFKSSEDFPVGLCVGYDGFRKTDNTKKPDTKPLFRER